MGCAASKVSPSDMVAQRRSPIRPSRRGCSHGSFSSNPELTDKEPNDTSDPLHMSVLHSQLDAEESRNRTAATTRRNTSSTSAGVPRSSSLPVMTLEAAGRSAREKQQEFGLQPQAEPARRSQSSSHHKRRRSLQEAGISVFHNRVPTSPCSHRHHHRHGSSEPESESASALMATTGRLLNSALEPSRGNSAQEHSLISPLSSNHIAWDSLEALKVIGEGAAGKVMKVRCKNDGNLYALKRIPRTASTARSQELRMLERVSDLAGVTKVHGVYQSRQHLYLLMDLCHSSLLETLLKLGRMPESVSRNIIRQVATTLAQIHQRGIIHGDIKPENILVTSSLENRTVNPQVKICDFGESAMVQQDQTVRKEAGTPAYSSPEKLQRVESSKPLDIWALGVVTFILLGGYHPFDEYSSGGDARMQQRIIASDWTFDNTGGEWNDVSIEAREFVSALLRHDPADRLTAAECLHHPWLRSAHDNALRRCSAPARPSTARPGATSLL